MSGVKLRIQSFSESITHEFILGFIKYFMGMVLTYVLILGSPVFYYYWVTKKEFERD